MRVRIVAEVAALRDAETALLAQARELQRSNQELEQFAYVASHDLQEPLRKVASFTQMLERRYKGQLDERADRYIAFAVDGAKRMQELINDLLEFSRVGRLDGAARARRDGRAARRRREARLAAVLEDAGGEVVADGLPAVTGDAGLLTAVFQNLISNAVKFRGDAPPRVDVRRRARRPLLALHVHRRRDRRRGRVRGAHLRHLPAPAHARGLRGHGHRAGHVPQDRRVPRRADLAGARRARPRRPVRVHASRRHPRGGTRTMSHARARRGDRRPPRRGRSRRRPADRGGVRRQQGPQPPAHGVRRRRGARLPAPRGRVRRRAAARPRAARPQPPAQGRPRGAEPRSRATRSCSRSRWSC